MNDTPWGDFSLDTLERFVVLTNMSSLAEAMSLLGISIKEIAGLPAVLSYLSEKLEWEDFRTLDAWIAETNYCERSHRVNRRFIRNGRLGDCL